MALNNIAFVFVFEGWPLGLWFFFKKFLSRVDTLNSSVSGAQQWLDKFISYAVLITSGVIIWTIQGYYNIFDLNYTVLDLKCTIIYDEISMVGGSTVLLSVEFHYDANVYKYDGRISIFQRFICLFER